MCKFIFPSISFKIEKWKWNEEYRVYVSSLGHFKDKHKKNMPVKINSKTGYCMIATPYGYKTAHRLVMLTFRPIPNAEDLTIDHLNHNKRDNSLLNLEWVTKKENIIRAKKDLFIAPSVKPEQDEQAEIIAGPWRFENEEAAAQYISAIYNANIDKIRRKIKIALDNKNVIYCGQIWKYNNK